MCGNVKSYMKRDFKTRDLNVRLQVHDAPVTSQKAKKVANVIDQLYCSTCDNMLDKDDPNVRDHLKFACPGIPCTPLKPGFSKQSLAKRMAVLGARKKLHNHNFTPHTPSDPTLVPLSPDKAVGS